MSKAGLAQCNILSLTFLQLLSLVTCKCDSSSIHKPEFQNSAMSLPFPLCLGCLLLWLLIVYSCWNAQLRIEQPQGASRIRPGSAMFLFCSPCFSFAQRSAACMMTIKQASDIESAVAADTLKSVRCWETSSHCTVLTWQHLFQRLSLMFLSP